MLFGCLLSFLQEELRKLEFDRVPDRDRRNEDCSSVAVCVQVGREGGREGGRGRERWSLIGGQTGIEGMKTAVVWRCVCR